MANGVAIEDVPDGFWFNLGGIECLYLMHVDIAGLGMDLNSVTISFEMHSSSSVREGMITLPRGTVLYRNSVEAS